MTCFRNSSFHDFHICQVGKEKREKARGKRDLDLGKEPDPRARGGTLAEADLGGKRGKAEGMVGGGWTKMWKDEQIQRGSMKTHQFSYAAVFIHFWT